MVFSARLFLRGLAPYALVAAVLVVGAMKPVAEKSGLTVEAGWASPCGGTGLGPGPGCASFLQQSRAQQNTMGWNSLSPFYGLPYYPQQAIVTPYQTGQVTSPYWAGTSAYNGFATMTPYYAPVSYSYGSMPVAPLYYGAAAM